jgi:hypothetical protein
LQAKKGGCIEPRVVKYVSEAGCQRRHAKQTTTVGFAVPVAVQMLYLAKITRMLVISRLVLFIVTNCMVAMSQAVDCLPGRREGDRDWRCNKGKDRRSGEPNRYSKPRPSHQRREHAVPVLRLERQT